jgi:hypothetical protein
MSVLMSGKMGIVCGYLERHQTVENVALQATVRCSLQGVHFPIDAYLACGPRAGSRTVSI